MKRGFLVRACALVVLTGLLLVPVFTQSVSGAATGYQVGYEKVDINPWVDLKLADGTTIGISANNPAINKTDAEKYIVNTTINDPKNPSKTISQKIVAVPLGGYGNPLERLATSMMDDNGDGKVGYGDGIYSTCTTITDANGKTVVYVTLDCVRASDSMTRDIRNGVVAAVGADKIAPEQIMLSASHSHSAPDFDYNSTTHNSVWPVYYKYVIARIVAAVKRAYDNRSAAEMTKGSIEAPAGMKARGYGALSLNFVRHATADATLTKTEYMMGRKIKSETFRETTVRTSHSGQIYYRPDKTEAVLQKEGYTGIAYGTKVVLKNNVSEADETLHVLQFTRKTGDPVLLVNWRAHAAMNGSGSDLRISSDYVGSLRYNLEKAGYCVGFWQGAAGNVNGGNMVNWAEDVLPTPWEDINIKGLDRAAKYGYLLAEVTFACLDKNMVDCEEGAIRNRLGYYYPQPYEDSPGMTAAVKQWQKDETAGKIDYPYIYETGGAKYVINSEYHAQQIIARERRKDDIKMELNVMMLGEDVALVTVPVEAFDRYSNDATLNDTTDNDWDDLIGETYGTPFVLGYSNDHHGYLPNKLAYEFNDFKPGDPYYGIYGKGSYESDTTKVAQGEGEAMIAELGNMLNALTNGYKTEQCEVCGKEATWIPLAHDQLGRDLEDGHYYLAEDIKTETKFKNSNIGSADTVEKVCLDLDGKTLDHKGQVFNVYSGSTLNIMDTSTGGKIIARSGGDLTGGLAMVNNGATVNVYGGTLQFIKDDTFTGNHTARGGVIYNSGTLNVYDGTIKGGEIVVSDWKDASTDKPLTPNGVGGAVAVVGNNATLNMFGGRIEAGPLADGVKGSCVYVARDSNRYNEYNAIKLTNDAYIEEIYVNDHYTKPRNIYFFGKFTGNVTWNLNESNITLNDKVYVACVSDDADISEATLRYVNDETRGFRVINESGQHRVYMIKGAYAVSVDEKPYTSLAAAIKAYTGGTIKLLSNTQSITLDKNVDLLDLNGFTVQKVTVNKGYTLTCMDSQTDDFTVKDNHYGKIVSVVGNVRGIPVEEDGYLMLGTDTNGDGIADTDVSFHRVDLNLTSVTLRAKSDGKDCNPGIYYTSNFAGDEKVKEKVKSFGVALSLEEEPNAANLGITNQYSYYNGANFQSGENMNSAASTLLRGIMLENADATANEANAAMPIYGRAYIQLTDGSYIFGNSHTGTLKGLLESISNRWEEYTKIQKNEILGMYKTYTQIMSAWNIDNIKNAAS